MTEIKIIYTMNAKDWPILENHRPINNTAMFICKLLVLLTSVSVGGDPKSIINITVCLYI